MRLLILTLLCTLFLSVTSRCRTEGVTKIVMPLGMKFWKDVCRQGIRPGSQADVDFLTNVIVPYYLSEEWLGVTPPADLERDIGNVIATCHNNLMNYCKIGEAMKVKKCLEHSAKNLVLKYDRMAWERDYCPIWNKKVANWEEDGKPQALKFFTQYCATKGKKC